MEDQTPNYPEHEKLSSRKREHKAIQSFCWFLSNLGLLWRVEVMEDERGDKTTVHFPLKDREIADLIAEYFGVDSKKFQEETHQMIEELRQIHKQEEK